jgi:hypothetical protein
MKTPGGGSNGRTGRARRPGTGSSDPCAFLHDVGPAGTMDGAVDASPSYQTGVGGVDDRIHALLGYVTAHQIQLLDHAFLLAALLLSWHEAPRPSKRPAARDE